MADEQEAAVTRSATNNVDHGPEVTTEDDSPTQVHGWLRKRSKRTHKWKRKWFTIRDKDLLYGNSEQVRYA